MWGFSFYFLVMFLSVVILQYILFDLYTNNSTISFCILIAFYFFFSFFDEVFCQDHNFCHNLLMWQVMSNGVKDLPLTTCHMNKLWQKLWYQYYSNNNNLKGCKTVGSNFRIVHKWAQSIIPYIFGSIISKLKLFFFFGKN